MSWKQTDYNLNTIHKKSYKQINSEYNRMKNFVSRRVSTFEKHNLGNVPQVKEIRSILDHPNTTRREKEMAIMEMRRFTLSENSTYTAYMRSLEDTIETFQGMGANVNKGNIVEFLQFLDWVKSFTSYNYNINDVKIAWEKSKGNIDGASDIFRSLTTDPIVSRLKARNISKHEKTKVYKIKGL